MTELTYNTATVYTDGDHDRFAHYAEKDEITKALVDGTPIVAICGKVWVPSRDPNGFPICPKCKELFDQLSWLNDGQV